MCGGEGRGRDRGAFTLLELLIVVVILGTLGAVVMPRFVSSADDAEKNACAHNRAVINAAVERWYLEKGEWPGKNLDDIGADPAYFPDGLPTCPVDGSDYKLDNDTHRVEDHNH